MIEVRNLLKTVPEGETPDLEQFGLDSDSIPFGLDLDTLKNVAPPETGDIVVNKNGQNVFNTGFGPFPLKSYMNKAETEELLAQVRKLDSWNLFRYDVRDSNEPK